MISARVVVTRRSDVFSAMHTTCAGRAGSAIRSCSSTSSESDGIGCPGQPSISVARARWQRTNACGADPCIRPSVTPEYGVNDRALPFDQQELPAASSTLDDELLRRASEEVRDDRVDGYPPPRDRDPGLPGGHEHRLEARRRASRSSSTATVFFPIAVGPDRQHDLRVDLEVRARRHVQAGRRLAEIAQLDPVPASELAQLWILGDELVQAALDVETAGDTALQELAPRGREPASLGCDAHDRHRGLERNGVGDGPDDGNAVMRLRSGGVEDRDDRVRAVANDPAHGLPVVRIVREPFAENEDAPLVAHVAATPRPGASEGTCTPSTSSTPG